MSWSNLGTMIAFFMFIAGMVLIFSPAPSPVPSENLDLTISETVIKDASEAMSYFLDESST